MKKTYSIIFKENLGNPLLSERELWTEDETYEFFKETFISWIKIVTPGLIILYLIYQIILIL